LGAIIAAGIGVLIVAGAIGSIYLSLHNSAGPNHRSNAASANSKPPVTPNPSDNHARDAIKAAAAEAENAESKAVERAREAIRKLIGALEITATEMIGSADDYSRSLDGHRSNLEKGAVEGDKSFTKALLKELAEMQSANDEYRAQIEIANEEIARQKIEVESLQKEVYVDFLTKIPNRRALDERFENETYRARRYNQPFSVMFIDIDDFKKLNDTHGHSVGDRVLRGIAMKIQASIRQSDYLGRYGGEEFVVLLPQTPLAIAQMVAEKIRRQLASTNFRFENTELQITVSSGVGQYEPEKESAEKFMARVDAAMYKAKKAGRDRVESAPIPA
jgi:diguanylate cyclase